MNFWLWLLVIALGVYGVGFLAMLAYFRGSNVDMALLWPLTLLWMFFGNIG